MQKAIAKTKYVRISPRKARYVADMIRGKRVEEVKQQLLFSRSKGGKLLRKTVDSAVANAETQLGLARKDLRVSEVRIDAGPTMKRAKSKCRGGRVPILQRTSHFTVVVEA